MILKEFNYYLKKATTLEEIQGSLLEKVNRWCDSSTGCIAHVFDTVLLKHWIVASDNVVELYKLDRNILLFSDFQVIYDRLDKIEEALPKMVTIATNQTITGSKTFSNTAIFNGTITSKGTNTFSGANTFTGNTTFNTGQVTFNNKAPISSVAPTAANHLTTKAYVDSVGNTAVKLTGNQTINGTKTFNNNIVSPNITAMQNNLNTIFSSTTSPVKTQTTTKIITVGVGGNFATLPQAFYEASKYSSVVNIKLVSNLEINSTLNISYVNGANILLDFNNFKIINTNTNINVSLNFISCKIGAIKKINLENVIFGAISGSLIYMQNTIDIINTNLPVGDCIRAWYGSHIAISDNTIINLKRTQNRFSIYSSVGSIIGIGGGSTINDNSEMGQVLNVYRGGIIQVTGSIINSTSANKANQAANNLTANGIIFGKL